MMRPREYAFATPADLGGTGNYRRFCRAVGLAAVPDGWGFLLCEDEDGKRVTRLTADVAYLRMLFEASNVVLAELEVPAEKFPNSRQGWPDEW
jgi:hypothetical protein